MSARTPVLNWHWLLNGITGSDELFIWLERLGDTIPERPKELTFLVIFVNGGNGEERSFKSIHSLEGFL